MENEDRAAPVQNMTAVHHFRLDLALVKLEYRSSSIRSISTRSGVNLKPDSFSRVLLEGHRFFMTCGRSVSDRR